jgi:uncharacterized membrane protein
MNPIDAEIGAAGAILAMAGATYLTRISGFWLMGHVPLTARLRRMLEALPGAVVAATVLPIVMKTGVPGAIAVAAAAGTMVARRNEFLAVAVGLGAAAAARAAGL